MTFLNNKIRMSGVICAPTGRSFDFISVCATAKGRKRFYLKAAPFVEMGTSMVLTSVARSATQHSSISKILGTSLEKAQL